MKNMIMFWDSLNGKVHPEYKVKCEKGKLGAKHLSLNVWGKADEVKKKVMDSWCRCKYMFMVSFRAALYFSMILV